MTTRMTRRLASLIAVFTLTFGLVATVFADAANPASVNVQVSGQTATLSGTWDWVSHEAPCDDRWVGWAVDWDDPNDPGTRVGTTDWYVGSSQADDNTVQTNRDCGVSSNPLKYNGKYYMVGTWGNISHTYTAPGTYQACVLMYDIHIEAENRTTLNGAINSSQTTIVVTSASGIAVGDDLKIDSERFKVTSVSGTTIGVTRGFAATTAAAHSNGATVKEMVPKKASEMVAGGSTKDDHNKDNSAETNGLTPTGATGAACIPATIVIPATPGLSTQVKSNGQAVSQVAPGTTVTDVATLTEAGGNGPVTGEVDFRVCGPLASAAGCASGGSDAGQNKVISSGTATSSGVTLTDSGYYCFRADYDPKGNAKYLATSHTNTTTECVYVPPTITVTKDATPGSLPEPGGQFTFDVTVHNNSSVIALTLTSLSDSVYGNLNGKGTCATGGTINPGATYSCSFSGTFTGNAGDQETDTVTAITSDGKGNSPQDSDEATVSLTDVLPSVTVLKTANDNSVPETGQDVTFTFRVTNNSTEAAEITVLSDSDFGTLTGDADCQVGTVLAAGAWCEFSETHWIAGDFGGPDHVNTFTATVKDDDGNTATDTDDETVTFTDVLPSVTVLKTANDNSVPETGQDVTFTFRVTNNSTEAAEITVLSDSDFGTLTGDADCQVGTVLAAGAWCEFSETHWIAGDFGGPDHVNTFTATVKDDDGNTATDTDDETVTFTDVLPSVTLDKSVDDSSKPEPGGAFTYTLTITNTSGEAVQITALTDDNALSAECTALVGTWLDPQESVSCEYSVTHTDAGTYPNTAEVTVADDEQNSASDDDSETVQVTDVLPTVTIDKSADPTVLDEPGGTFTFTLEITNTSVEPVQITALTDDNALSAECLDLIGTWLDPQETVSCEYTVEHTNAGQYDNTAEVTVIDNEENSASADDDATVQVANLDPSVEVTKDAEPGTLPEPGGDFTFTVSVTNTSVETVTLIGLWDDVYGDLLDADNENVSDNTCLSIDTTLSPDETVNCSFTGAFNGDAFESQTDTVLATVVDDEQNEKSGMDDATVSLTDVLPTISVVKDAAPGSVGPGGSATFTVRVTNTTAVESVWLTSLVDDVHGDLDGRGSCVADGSVQILPGATYTCSFSAVIQAAAGSSETDTVTATVIDNEKNEASDEDTATVAVVNLAIDKAVVNSTADRGTVTINNVAVIKSRPGDILHYTLTYTVTGGGLTGVTITDVLPTGLGTPSNISNGGVFAAGTITWNLGTVTTSGSVSYDVVVAVGADRLPQPMRNTATIDSDQTEPDSAVRDVAVEIPPLAATATPVPPTLPPTSTVDGGDQAGPGMGLWTVLLFLSGLAFLASLLTRTPARTRRLRR